MALLSKDAIERVDKYKYSIHKPTNATYTIFELDEETYFQIDTYGSENRKNPLKASQSLQMDREMAIHLIELLSKEYNLNIEGLG